MQYAGLVFERVNWSGRGAYKQLKHGLSPQGANEALADPNRVVIAPDYNSRSGRSVRIIGYSDSEDDIMTVIVLEHDGIEYGVNGWVANGKDRRLYYTDSQDQRVNGEADEQEG